MRSHHQSGEVIANRYRIIDILGEGNSGITYGVEDLQTKQKIALKAFSFQKMTDWKMMELFEREAKILQQLNHPAIPSYLDYFQVDTEDERAFYIAQQLAEGQSLATLVDGGWHRTETEVKEIAVELLKILVYLHLQKPPIIHRDIKPHNIIRRDDGKIFLVDFGAVKHTYHSTLMRGSTVVGTFGYMAPEQFRGQAFPATDLYSLGATILFLLTHRSPAELPVERLKLDFRDRIQVSEEFADWLEKILEPDVEDRFTSASEALAILQPQSKPIIQSLPWQGIGIAMGLSISAIAGFQVLNAYKYSLLNAWGFTSYLHTAIYNESIDVQDYINGGGDINGRNKSGGTLLHDAVDRSNLDAAQFLLDRGVDVNGQDNQGLTPLHLAKSEAMVKLLIERGANVNQRNYQGQTPLHLAKTQPVVEFLIFHGADVNLADNQGKTILHHLSQTQHTDIIKLALDRGANLNLQDNQGKTLLHLAIENRNRKLALFAIKNKANLNLEDNQGHTPLYIAKKIKLFHIVSFLKSNGAKFSSADLKELTTNWQNWQTSLCSPYELAWLIANEIDINTKNKNGFTPLLYTLKWNCRNQEEAARLLINAGADVNVQENEGNTALHLTRKQKIVEMLLNAGANVNIKNNVGDTPLHSVVNYSNLVQLLVDKGADVNASNNKGKTPLHFTRRTSTARLLINAGADITVRDNKGNLPPIYANLCRRRNSRTQFCQ